MNKLRNRTAGFSGVEMLVIVAVIGVIVLVGYPRLATLLPIYRLEGAARRLAMDLGKARGRAIAEGRCFQVVIDATAKTYQVKSKAGAASCGTAGFSADPTDLSARKIDDADLLTVSSTADPVFNPRGRMETNPAPVITSTNSAGAVRTVYVVFPTGRVYVQ